MTDPTPTPIVRVRSRRTRHARRSGLPPVHGAARRAALGVAASAIAGVLAGCEMNSFFDPSKTGAFNTTASTMPVLTRIDAIESDAIGWRNAGPPQPEDLLPNDFEYRLVPGDVLRVEIFELMRTGEMSVVVRVIDQSGSIRLPTLGEIPVAGLSIQTVQDAIEERVRRDLLMSPLVTVALDDERGLQFTVLGRIGGAGPYRLVRPDLRLLEALAIAGGIPETTSKIYVVRRVPLDTAVTTPWDQRRPGVGAPGAPSGAAPAVDIEELIRDLERREGGGDAPPIDPGALAQTAPPPVDVDDLAPAAAPRPTAPRRSTSPQGGRNAIPTDGPPDEFRFDQQRNAWVRVPGAATGGTAAAAPRGGTGGDILDALPGGGSSDGAATPMFAERVIVVDYRELIRGDSALNVVVRPNDLIYVQPNDFGFVYIDGEIARAGSYQLPITGGLTLSRLVASAGGLNGIAIPDRVEITRAIGVNREATVRVNLAAIRRRTEPDFLLKPDDHIIIGTNFWAVPLAVIRNGFRATYGFGFLLDRNFGNDVFGAPPTNITGG